MQSTPRLRLEIPTWRNFTICGARPEDGQQDPPKTGAAESGSAAAGSGAGSAGDDKTKDPEARIRSLQEEKDRHYTARQQAETELNELRKEKEERERATLSDAEKTAKDLEAAQKNAEALVQTNRRLSIHNAFLLENSVQWNNPEDALTLADLSAVETADDGTIKNPDAVKAAITKLAKDKAYLVKAAADDEAPKTPPPGSGTPPQGAPPKTNGLDTETLRRKYPALRAH